MSRRHDQSYKLLFSLPLAVEHMIRRFIDADLAGELDFERAENLATERTTPGLVRRTAPDDIFDLIEPVRGWLAERQPRLRHQLLDLRAFGCARTSHP